MPRDHRVSLKDVLEAIDRIERYVSGMTVEQFRTDSKTLDAVVRNLEIIGEAVKNLPQSARDQSPEVPWQRIAGLRNFLIHVYFNVDVDIIWDIAQNKLPELKAGVIDILGQETEPEA